MAGWRIDDLIDRVVHGAKPEPSSTATPTELLEALDASDVDSGAELTERARRVEELRAESRDAPPG